MPATTELHLFAGIGGGILAGHMLGHRTVAAVEIDKHCRGVLARHFPELPIHDDIRTFDGTRWRGQVDVVCGGFPCQDVSAAGTGKGLEGSRSGLWFEMLRVVREVEPGYVFVENSPLLRSRGLGHVLHGLAELGFDAEWTTLGAAHVGAPHLRQRLWLLGAHPDRRRCEVERLEEHGDQQGQARHESDRLRPWRRRDGQVAAYPSCPGLPLSERQILLEEGWRQEGRAAPERGWWSAEPDVGRMAHGVPRRVGRLRALGNAQVPLQAATAWRVLMERLCQDKS